MLFLFIIGMLLILLAYSLLRVNREAIFASVETNPGAKKSAGRVTVLASNSSSLNKYYSDRLLTREGFVGISSNRASSTGYELDNIWYQRW